MTSKTQAEFVHVGDEKELEALRAFKFNRVNACRKREAPDNGGWFLIFLGESEGKRYSGHLYIVRCRDQELQDKADRIIRESLQIVGGSNV